MWLSSQHACMDSNPCSLCHTQLLPSVTQPATDNDFQRARTHSEPTGSRAHNFTQHVVDPSIFCPVRLILVIVLSTNDNAQLSFCRSCFDFSTTKHDVPVEPIFVPTSSIFARSDLRQISWPAWCCHRRDHIVEHSFSSCLRRVVHFSFPRCLNWHH